MRIRIAGITASSEIRMGFAKAAQERRAGIDQCKRVGGTHVALLANLLGFAYESLSL